MFEVAVPSSSVPLARIVATDCEFEAVVRYAYMFATDTLSVTVKLVTTSRLFVSDIVADEISGAVWSGVKLAGVVLVVV